MENIIIEAIKLFNPLQLISVGVVILFAYNKTKSHIKNDINGLGSRFDNQFGEYKDKNADRMTELEHRLYKLEVESSFINNTKTLEAKVDKILVTSGCSK